MSNATTMSGIASKLQHDREKAQGIGTNSHAVKYLGQDYEALRRDCLESGRLFQDDTFEAEVSSLGFNELGPSSYKVRGVTWKRPTVGNLCCIFCFLLIVCWEGCHPLSAMVFKWIPVVLREERQSVEELWSALSIFIICYSLLHRFISWLLTFAVLGFIFISRS